MIQHPFVSPVADDADPNTVSPSDWNAAHVQLRTLTASATLPANASMIVAGDYEIAAGVVLELGADAVLEVT